MFFNWPVSAGKQIVIKVKMILKNQPVRTDMNKLVGYFTWFDYTSRGLRTLTCIHSLLQAKFWKSFCGVVKDFERITLLNHYHQLFFWYLYFCLGDHDNAT